MSRKCVLKHKLTCFENVYASSESSSHCQQLYTHRIVARMKTRFGMFLCILLPSCKLRLFPLPSSFRRRFIRGGGIFYPCIGHDLPHHYLFVISSIVIRMVFYEHNQSLTFKISSCWDLRKQLFANPEILLYLCSAFLPPPHLICHYRITRDVCETRARRGQEQIESRLTRDLFAFRLSPLTRKMAFH